MPEARGGLFITFEPARRQVLQDAAKMRGRFSVELSASDWDIGRKEMFLIGFSDDRESVDCAALGRRKSGPRNTGAYNIEFTGFVFFEQISLPRLLKALPTSARQTVKEREGRRGKWFPPVAWGVVLTQLGEERPFVRSAIESLWSQVNSPDSVVEGNQLQKLALQRDAIGLSLEIAGLADMRRQTFRKISGVKTDAKIESFISLMDSQVPQERTLVDYDRSIFETLIARGESQSAIFSDGPRNLRVWTVDKSKIEHFAGVDLVILNRDYNSLLLLQYKCMEQENVCPTKQWRYRPDDQFSVEIERMERVRELIQRHTPAESRLEDIRLDRGALYFKFCKRLPLSQQDGELADGMVVSLSGTQRFLGSKGAKGPKEGCYIGYDNCERYFNNSLFAALARDGWIGTHGLSDSHYKEVLGLIQEQEERSLVLSDSYTVLPEDAAGSSRRRRFRR